MVKSLIIGYADSETEHYLDLEAQGKYVKIDGNVVTDQNGEIPTVRVKCLGMIVKNGDHEEEFMYHNVKEFLQGLVDNNVDRCYFHNLKFDDSFIASYMKNDTVVLEDGWKVVCKHRMINDMGAVYSDVLTFEGPRDKIKHRAMKHKCEIWDSAKIWASDLRSLGESFGVYKKGEGSDEALRVGCDKQMEEYCLQDCRVMMTAMEYYFERCKEETEGERPYGWMTAASTSYNLCMRSIRHMIPGDMFKTAFPACDANHGFPDWLREGYKGAVPLLDPVIRNKPLKDVKVFDINSMYPDKLRNYMMPIGYPVKIKEMTFEHLMKLKQEGKLWVAKVKMVADVKLGHRATYLLKRKGANEDTLCWHINDLEGCDDRESFQVITSVDIEYIIRDYTISYIEVLDCVGFRVDNDHLIAPFIDDWYSTKEEASNKKDKPLKAFAKLILNALYGKFGANPEHGSSEYTFVGDMIRVKETDQVDVDKHPLYLPIAMFTTAYARNVISKSCNALGWEHVAYTDTDSVHVYGISVEECYKKLEEAGFEIHHTHLGAWDFESRWDEALYVRNKGYFHFGPLDLMTGEPIEGKNEIKMAGANGFEGLNCMADVLDKELYGTQKRGYRVNGGILIMEKKVAIDTRMDAAIQKTVRKHGMNRSDSMNELNKTRKEILAAFV